MNVNLLINDNYFAPATDNNIAPLTSDQNNTSAKFSLSTDNKQSEINNLEKQTIDKSREQSNNLTRPDHTNTHTYVNSNHNETTSENPNELNKDTKPKEETTTSVKIKQKNLCQSSVTENLVIFESDKKSATSKPNKNLAQITTNKPTAKPSHFTVHAAKQAEIKLLHTTEQAQLGLKTVLPVKSNGQNGLKTVLPGVQGNKNLQDTKNDTGKAAGATTTGAKIKAATEKKDTTDLVSKVTSIAQKNTNVSSIKQTIENVNLKTIQTKSSETQDQVADIDKAKLASKTQTNAKTTDAINTNLNGKQALHAGNNIPENQSVQKLNTETVQASNVQTKDQSNSTSIKNPSQGFEQMLSHSNSQTVITEKAYAAKNTTATDSQSQTFKDISADVGKQVLESVQRSISEQGTDRQITVRLNPPELGKVLIKFQQQDNELTGVMEVNKAQTRFEIEQSLPQIIRSLANSGIHIKRLEVTLSNEQQSGQGTSTNHSLQSGGSQQQYSGNPGTAGNDMDIPDGNQWSADNNIYENLYESQESFITDRSINMLI